MEARGVFRGASLPLTRQTGLMQIAWNMQGTVNATILRTTQQLVTPT